MKTFEELLKSRNIKDGWSKKSCISAGSKVD